jgi:coenzyme F420-0:L-glutamate ligase/coenzyme F420-1:gamma-L-glutamate ligase
MNNELRIIPIANIGEVSPGADLGTLIFNAMRAGDLTIEAGDIIVITQKIVSKAEGRIVNLDDVQPSDFALRFARQNNKDARHVEVVLRESRRIVRMDRGVLIAETQHGFICANAGVDESNVNGAQQLTLLPVDPDGSARALRHRLQELINAPSNIDIAVIISDTWGRPWRNAQVNMAIGVAGIAPIADYRGQLDPYGFEMRASMIAVADELASAAELVMGKIDRVPAAIIRGYAWTPGEGNGRALLRDASTDMFR